MAQTRFADVMKKERERLNSERETMLKQRRELDKKLSQIERELHAVDLYERARSGKAPAAARGRGRPRQTRRGSRREALLALIKENPSGLSRGEILQHMSLKGDKSGEMSVSNALTALIKAHQIARQDRKYVIHS